MKRTFCARNEERTDSGECKRPDGRCQGPRRRTASGFCKQCDGPEFWNVTLRDCSRCPHGTSNDGVRPHTKTRCRVCQKNASLLRGKCVCRRPFANVGKRCNRCPSELVYKDGKCVACHPGWFRLERFGGGQCSKSCNGARYYSNKLKKCVMCPAGFQKMKNIAGREIDGCAPKDPYGPTKPFFLLKTP